MYNISQIQCSKGFVKFKLKNHGISPINEVVHDNLTMLTDQGEHC
jgi:hypothetical protein